MGIRMSVNSTEFINFFTYILKSLVASHSGGQQWYKHATCVRTLYSESRLIMYDQESRRKFEFKDVFRDFSLKQSLKALR